LSHSVCSADRQQYTVTAQSVLPSVESLCLQYTVTVDVEASKRRARSIDKVSRKSFPTAFLLFNVVDTRSSSPSSSTSHCDSSLLCAIQIKYSYLLTYLLYRRRLHRRRRSCCSTSSTGPPVLTYLYLQPICTVGKATENVKIEYHTVTGEKNNVSISHCF